MKQKWSFGSYTTYLWTLITILLTVAIIFVCTYLPGLLWNLTSQNAETRMHATLDLPDVEEIISSSVDTSAIPPYFPTISVSQQLPDVSYELTAVDKSTDPSGEFNAKITAFSNLVENAVASYFYLSCSASIVAQHTNLWSVRIKGQPEIVDTYCSSTVVVQQQNQLWTVTAYGFPTSLTHLSRTPYSDSDTNAAIWDWDDAELIENTYDTGELSDESLEKIFADFLINSAFFNWQLAEESADILEMENYEFSQAEYTAQGRSYTIRFWSERYNATFQMVIHVQSLNKWMTLCQMVSISQIS